MRAILLILFFCLPLSAWAQKNGYVILSGRVTDFETKAPLEGANILFSGLSIGAKTDSTGRFSLTLPARTYQIVVRSLGYKFKLERIELTKSMEISVAQSP